MTLGGLLLGGSAVVAGHWLSQPVATAVPRDDGSGGTASVGPDVIVGAIPNISKYGASGGIAAYAFGSTSCNIGTTQLDWFAGTNQHPVIPQNTYRFKNGRFEQIGMSFVKHGFCALQQTLCGSCQPAGGGCPSMLGIGCSDPYDSGLNGDQSNLGPRSQINASTGFFPYPFTNLTDPTTPAVLKKRVQMKLDDLNPAMNAGAVYYAECQYIHPDDAAVGNDDNNSSYRKFTVGTLTGGSYNLALTGATFQQKVAMFAWKDNDPAVTLQNVDVSNDGRFWIGYRVTDNGDGTWHYEFAVQNMNSDRAGGSFSIPVADGVTLTNIGFTDVHHHSGELQSTVDWTATVADGSITWATQTFGENPNANAIRWSTMYNFRFDANSPPVLGTGSLGLFKAGGAGDPAAVSFAVLGPDVAVDPCLGDFNNDGTVGPTDLAYLLGSWGGPDADADGNGTTDAADLAIVLGAWGACP